MSRKHIVFDLDGTLVDSALHCAALLSEMLEERGSLRRITRTDAVPHMSYGGPYLVTTLLGDECGDSESEVTNFRARYAARPTPERCIYPGVRQGLATLAGHGFVLGVCSNKPQALCDKIVDELGLRPSIASVVGGRADLPAKPHRAMLDLNLTEMGGTAETALLVGDSEVDHELAIAAGLPFWLVSYGYPGQDWMPVAEAWFDGFEQVVAALCAADDRPERLIV
ncbi:MAG: HAD family hydrolase [Sphingomicrobium sp.]|nr:HAD hydrolase-like protein [Sphingomonadales bacterium]